jgi:hypothetical protein
VNKVRIERPKPSEDQHISLDDKIEIWKDEGYEVHTSRSIKTAKWLQKNLEKGQRVQYFTRVPGEKQPVYRKGGYVTWLPNDDVNAFGLASNSGAMWSVNADNLVAIALGAIGRTPKRSE